MSPWGAIAVGWGRGLRTVSAKVSFALAIEALAFIHEACAFVSGHATGTSMARGSIHGIWVALSTFAVKPWHHLFKSFFLDDDWSFLLSLTSRICRQCRYTSW